MFTNEVRSPKLNTQRYKDTLWDSDIKVNHNVSHMTSRWFRRWAWLREVLRILRSW